MALARAKSAVSERVNALKIRHTEIARQIEESMKHFSTNDLDLRRLKSAKLHIKDEIEQIR